FQAEDGIRDFHVTGVQTCALPISRLRAAENKSPPIAPAVRLSCIRMIHASTNCLKFYYFFRGITLLGDVRAAGAGIVSAERLRIFTDNDFKLGYFLRIKA